MGIIVEYTELGSVAVPLVTVEIGPDHLPIKGLADTGATNSVLAAHLAEDAGIDLGEGVEAGVTGVGGHPLPVLRAPTWIRLVGDEGHVFHEWEADLAFAATWGRPYSLLGDQAFFRHFEVTFRSAAMEIEIELAAM